MITIISLDVSSLNGAQQCDCWGHHSSFPWYFNPWCLGNYSGRSKIIYFKRLDHASYSILLFYMADPTIIKDESHHFFLNKWMAKISVSLSIIAQCLKRPYTQTRLAWSSLAESHWGLSHFSYDEHNSLPRRRS